MEAEKLSKEQIDSSEATKVGDFPMETSSFGGQIMEGGFVLNRGSLALGLSEDERQTVAMRPKAFITYRVSYQCKHCGKKWTKLEVEAKPLPREYVEDEQEKTDYDAHVEEEEAREDEYSREQ
ncbi:MAG TPA: hypothetical protein VNA15_12955 [Candidatus Angelobacter sp.]|nr:hypothetical protein [Candidatus Angelobacter sp.]